MIKKGEYVTTPRFLRVRIEDVFATRNEAENCGYTEQTYYENDEYGVLGKSIGLSDMLFAAYSKLAPYKNVNILKEKYKEGTKIRLLKMDDIQAPPKGTIGTIRGVDDIGNILVSWNTGSTLSLIPDIDEFEVL